MSLGEKIFDAMRTGAVMNQKLSTLVDKVERMDTDMRDLDRRIIRLETTVDIYTRSATPTRTPKRIPE
ncbi:hypothetical protein [Desulfatitalea alkaliphila]|uniref:Uncharacterized protein n=1 Tax=Desulfatitalea alkaliphila TaxID=2929485 RepID=A0AA41R6E2_9BACT|nr:hypothetical protein [Desulfatitalea alkaliphila]MCJ8502492.1 hypothetical protein [Desulfatitalea alkaliphila]